MPIWVRNPENSVFELLTQQITFLLGNLFIFMLQKLKNAFNVL